ncbi:MAG TPA: lycopene cyclase domain-containing protein [Candidatus Kapabacteria bacterium]|nr:lycopene cyclase domain-containing protein [Candidatus Kapabacteria bacterium]
MTYLQFHLLFNLPLLLLLFWRARRRLRSVHWKWIGVTELIVLAFSYPWDSWAVRRGVWGFAGDRVILHVGVLPVEEIAFFVLETLAVCLMTVLLLPAHDNRH